MPVDRPFIDYGLFAIALPLTDLLAVWAVTAAFCIFVTEACQRWVSPWLKHRAGTLGRDDDEAKILELSVRTTSVLYTGVIYVFSFYDLMYGDAYPNAAYRALGLGYIQPMVAASLMAYMAVDIHYLNLRRKFGMKSGRYWTVLIHHLITFGMQPVSFWTGFWQFYGNYLVVIAESTSLLSNLFVLLPDLGFPRDSDIYKLNTVVFAVVFIVCRVFGLGYVSFRTTQTAITALGCAWACVCACAVVPSRCPLLLVVAFVLPARYFCSDDNLPTTRHHADHRVVDVGTAVITSHSAINLTA